MCSLQKCIRFYLGTLASRSASEIFCLFSNSTSLSFSSCFFPHVFVKKNVFVCFDFVFRGGLQNLFVLMNGKTVDSLYLMGYFYITSIIFSYTSCLWAIRMYHKQLVYAWRKHDLLLLCVQIIWWWAQATCRQRTCNEKDKWNILTVFLQVKLYGYFTILEWSTTAAYVFRSHKEVLVNVVHATVHIYGKPTSFKNRKRHLRVSQDFH